MTSIVISEPVVSVDWLHSNLDAENLIVLDASIKKVGGGDITAIFSTGEYLWDTSPAKSIILTEGSDASPQINYIYLLESTKLLTKSTSGFPATEHVPIATIFLQSDASAQTDGVMKMHAWTDHLSGTDKMGHISHINEWIRKQPATWEK